MPTSEHPPERWSGWPNGKKFAVVLTHDVEGHDGVRRCRQLMQLELEMGFRSSFNFIPEGSYKDPRGVREELSRNGFEVGVHDLRHDGWLYRSRQAFIRNSGRIKRYLSDWGAVGFRSGFMLHNLDWLHDLDLQYDTSTFDTDPFEPQPEGRHTIFPFWVPAPEARKSEVRGQRSEVNSGGGQGTEAGSDLRPPASCVRNRGYVELPYTLPQDSTLFLLLRETSIDLWRKKVDWIAEHGGMALVNTHPDYMAMRGSPRDSREFPVELYLELLRYISSKYSGQYWHALPREVATLIRDRELGHPARQSQAPPLTRHPAKQKPKIWIDLDNTPHVPFFEPIIDELKARGFPLVVTARDAFQVCQLADKKGVRYVKIGRHHGKNWLLKGAGLMHRSMQLAPLIIGEKPALGVSHGARSQLLLGNWLRMPTLLLEDYEHCQFPIMMKPTWIMAPEVIPDDVLPLRNGNRRTYPGLKEDVYAWKLVPDPGLLSELGVDPSDVVITVRPPATEAHYHNPESETLFDAFMDRASQTPGATVILLPRNQRQRADLEARKPEWFAENRTVIPKGAVDGMNLVWHSDLVVSGGGTMNREAAALDVPVFSLFRGTLGAVDQHLSTEGRLHLINSLEDVDGISLVKRVQKPMTEITSRRTLQTIVDAIDELAQSVARSR